MSTPVVQSVPSLLLEPSDEERAIRESLRALCAQFGRHYGRERWEAREGADALHRALADAGFVGIAVPEEHGGGGLGMAGLAIVAEEVTRALRFLPVTYPITAGVVGVILAKHGTVEQQQRWLAPIAKGDFRFAFAITEPDAGSNSHQLRTQLRPDGDGDGYRLSGQKCYVSAVEEADGILVVARLRGEDGLGLPTLCVIDPEAEGVSRDEIPMPYLGPDRQWQLFFDDVHVPRENIVGGEQAGLRALFDGLNPERIVGAAGMLGVGEAALEQAVGYANERAVWDAPIGTHQGVAHPLAEAKVELDLARLMTEKAAALYDAGSPACGAAANVAKYAAAEAAIKCVDRAIETHGGNGLALEYGLSDLYWLARLARIAPVSREMILNHVAEHALGLPKSY